MVVTERELWYDDANRQLMYDTAADLGFDATGVPTTIIEELYWVGFSDSIAAEIEEALVAAGARGVGRATSDPPRSRPADSTTVDVPLLGPVTLDSSSLMVSMFFVGLLLNVGQCRPARARKREGGCPAERPGVPQ